MNSIEALLNGCTVKLTIPGQRGWGTGFFVTPNHILTCAHVVKGAAGQPIQVRWQAQENFLTAAIEQHAPDKDLALLRFTPPTDAHLPCVDFDPTLRTGDDLYLFGYPDTDFPDGCPVTGLCEGLTGEGLIKFKLGQIRPGMSGAPLLNRSTRKVCGVVRFTRDRAADLGGGAIPIAVACARFPELLAQNRQFHQHDGRWRQLLAPDSPPVRQRQAYRNRQALLDKVHNHWIKGVLEPSLYTQAKIAIQLEERRDQIPLLEEAPEHPRRSLSPEETVVTQFEALGTGRTLLILGEPGSGKTTLLLELARELLEHTQRDANQPIPVVFNLSSWALEKRPLAEWLLQELLVKFQVPKTQGQGWLEQQQLLLLLDGLDEVQVELRERCVHAINHFSQTHGLTEMVVCCRIAAYEALTERLTFQAALFAKPLTPEQINTYLAHTKPDLAGVKAALENDPVLSELVRSPLMLSVVATAYAGLSPTDLPTSLEEQYQRIFEQYIHRALRSRRQHARYDPDAAIRWLSFLAQRMLHDAQTTFLIEQIQPAWLPPRLARWLYPAMVALIAGLLAEFIFGTLVGFIGDWLSVQLFLGLLSGLVFGALSSLRPQIQLLERMGWSWSVDRAWQAAIPALVGGPLIGLLISFGTFINLPVRGWLFNLGVGLVGGSLTGLVLAIVSSLLGGLKSTRVDRKSFPNQGIWRSLQRSAISTFLCALLLTPPLLLLAHSGVPLATLLGVITVFLSFISLHAGGLAAIQHFTTRLILWSTHQAPWNYADFLNDATERLLMQRVGGSYQFVHDLLKRQLAGPQSMLALKSPPVPQTWPRLGLVSIGLAGLLLVGNLLPICFDVWLVGEVFANNLKPRIEPHERILIDKVLFRFSELQRWDIIIINPTPLMEKQGFDYLQDMKQIIGLPGETLEIRPNGIYINRRLLDLPVHPDLQKYGPILIPKDSYFVMVNNPNYKDDHSQFIGGVIHKTNIAGRSVFSY
jgi:signal peptidase I